MNDMPVDAGAIVLRITPTTLDFLGGCHFYMYPYDRRGSNLQIQKLNYRRCGFEKLPVLDDVIDSAIGKTTHFREASREILLLDTNERSVLRLIRLGPTGLENRRWAIVSYFDGGTLTTPWRSYEQPPDVLFAGGNISGSAGCHYLEGDYSLSDDKLEARPNRSPIRLAPTCNRLIERQTARIADALTGNLHVEEAGNQFLLADANGQVRLVLEPWRR